MSIPIVSFGNSKHHLFVNRQCRLIYRSFVVDPGCTRAKLLLPADPNWQPIILPNCCPFIVNLSIGNQFTNCQSNSMLTYSFCFSPWKVYQLAPNFVLESLVNWISKTLDSMHFKRTTPNRGCLCAINPYHFPFLIDVRYPCLFVQGFHVCYLMFFRVLWWQSFVQTYMVLSMTIVTPHLFALREDQSIML